jgi:uncharacterized protein YjbI with pentapeptide repeats
MANQQHLDILAKGVEEWNAWREQEIDWRPDLSDVDLNDVDLSGADLRGAHLLGADLPGADLSRADLTIADLRDANLRGAILSEAKLGGADLSGADLSRANLSDADLSGAQLIAADLSRANLSGADLRGATLNAAELNGSNLMNASVGTTVFGHVDLSTVKGLDTVTHARPSEIGIGTIYRSKGNIEESFLRGCGVPENFITFMRSLSGKAFDFYSCFISYSTKDDEFAQRLYESLQARRVRCWFAPHDIQGGRKVHEQIDEAIRIYDKLLLILSDASMNSPWVKTEIANARAKEVQQERQVLFPITLVPYDRIKAWKLFDADTGIDSAREIREYFVPDFSEWKNHDSYAKAFDRLVRDLKAGPKSKGTATTD